MVSYCRKQKFTFLLIIPIDYRSLLTERQTDIIKYETPGFCFSGGIYIADLRAGIRTN
jgi:hypothetical protein